MVFYMYTCFTILHVHFFQNSSTMNMLDLIFLSYVVSRIFASAPPPECARATLSVDEGGVVQEY
jgi:hypothetical protein